MDTYHSIQFLRLLWLHWWWWEYTSCSCIRVTNVDDIDGQLRCPEPLSSPLAAYAIQWSRDSGGVSVLRSHLLHYTYWACVLESVIARHRHTFLLHCIG